MKLIDRESLVEHMRKAYEGHKKIGFKWDLISTVAVIGAEEEITPDAQPIRHGHWDSRQLVYECSECGHMGYSNMNYCPNCGAKMDEVKE